MISTRSEYESAQTELRDLQDRLEELQRDRPVGEKGFAKAGIRKMIARLHEELAIYEGSEEARSSKSNFGGRRLAAMQFQIGDRVVRNPTAWRPNAFDAWGRGVGIGEVVEPPFALGPDEVDVRWPGGRCFEWVEQLLPAPKPNAEPGTASDPAA